MVSFFLSTSRRPYHPLDDDLNDEELLLSQDLDISEDIPANYISGHDPETDALCNCCVQPQIQRIPRINFAYFNNDKWKKRFDILICLFVLSCLVGVSVRLGVYTLLEKTPAPVIDKSYQAFRIPQHEASMHWGALQAAKRNLSKSKIDYDKMATVDFDWVFSQRDQGKSRAKRQSSFQFAAHEQDRVLEQRDKRDVTQENGNQIITALPQQYYPLWRMQVVFMAKDGENIFTREKLQHIHEIEKKIIAHEKFSEFCLKDPFHAVIQKDPAVKAINGCAPLNSLLSYFFPSKDEIGNVYYDGLGENMDNIDSALKLAMTSTKFYYYVDEKVNSSFLKSRLIRTEVLFGAPLKGFSTPYLNRHEQTQKFKDFVVSYINLLSQSSNSELSVLYGGNEIFDYEVETTFWQDLNLAVYALLAIFVLMLVLTSGSIWLTFWGFISILLSAPLAIFFYRVVFGVRALGILNGAAAFVIIGIGVDDVFVFINVYRQATHLHTPRARTKYTIVTAGKSTFFTSFTTAAAFAANMASMIPAVHDFGLFMSLIVANCWLTVMISMPPVLYIWDIAFRHCEGKIYAFLCCCLPKSLCTNLSVPDDVSKFLDNSNHGDTGHVTSAREVTSDEEEDDVPLLSMENPLQYIDTAEDDSLVLVDPDPLVLPEDIDNQKACHLGAKLQATLYHYMVVPVIKARWFIIGITTILLFVSVGLLTQLKTSTKPPQFFREDTNIQQLLNLKSRYSAIDTVTCNDCSAIYSLGEKASQKIPTPSIKQLTTTKQTEGRRPDQQTTAKPNPPGLPKITTTRKPYIKPTQRPQPQPKPHTSPHPHILPLPLTSPKPPPYVPRTIKPVIVPSIPINPSNEVPVKVPTLKSVPENYDVCKDADCSHPKERPLLESGATVYVVLGVKDFHWSQVDVGHVMSENLGEIQFDPAFASAFNFTNPKVRTHLAELCTVCKEIASNRELVKNGSAQCLPTNSLPPMISIVLHKALAMVPECKNLPEAIPIYGNQQPAHALGGLTDDVTSARWIAFAFSSTTSKGKSYFEAHKEYKKWEIFLQKVRSRLPEDSPMKNLFQTSEFWPEVFMEIVAVDSAIYGVVLSMVICMLAVVIFTRHLILLLIIFISITEMVCLVVGIFYILGWEVGGVEAISLSILVGSSVDYCVHLVEGYILAGKACPFKDDARLARQWRTKATFSHIGVSIISSALTTIIAAIPLTQTTIQPFAKFGQIIAINTSVCILYSLTLCVALLSTIAPPFYKPNWKSLVKAIVGTAVVVGLAVLLMFVLSRFGVDIPGPNGGSLF
ncbi:protein dispatched homolog 3-like [Mya arenaria]|uniref:protein dispatched homolog 3-like n=1 Tax=Mya arenaria TaxID=6604 RepID=UPI0022DFB8B9|nr:protein dispatched homolog 3-like [Mya arenaria]